MKYIFILVLFITSRSSFSQQQCGNCSMTPSIALYDVNVEVAKPSEDNIDAVNRWKNLFWVGKTAIASLFQANKSCIRFSQPFIVPSSTSGDDIELAPLIAEEGVIKVGETVMNTAPAGELPDKRGYITTGYIRQTGSNNILHLELQTACSRKTVISTEVTFLATDDFEKPAKQAASQLSPLLDKINRFELQERQKDKSMSLYQLSFADPVKITPAKTILKAGESTEFTIEVKDCDGVPLAGREVLFNAAIFEGARINATIGGIVTPAKVITDANGIARAKFTLNSGADAAIINVHSPGFDVKSCPSMYIGSATINIKKTYSGYVKYSFSGSSNCEEVMKSDDAITSSKGTSKEETEYSAYFYDDSPNEGSVELSTEEDAAVLPKIIGSGNWKQYEFKMTDHVLTCNCVGSGEHTISVQKITRSGELKSGRIYFTFPTAEDKGALKIYLKFNMHNNSVFKATGLPDMIDASDEDVDHTIDIEPDIEKEFTIKKQMNNGKSSYVISGTKKLNQGCAFNSTLKIKAVITQE